MTKQMRAELGELEEELYLAGWCYCHCCCGGRTTAAALRAVLNALGAGQAAVGVVTAALGAWRRTEQEHRAELDRRWARSDVDEEQEAAREAAARTVACPRCGAQPQDKCRTMGEANRRRTRSHRDRARAAVA